jgi:hypothetical protein
MASASACSSSAERKRGSCRRRSGVRIPVTAGHADELAIRDAYRSAVVSVIGLDREATGRLMELAALAGDHLLARAVATAAFQQGWNDIADVYATGGDDPHWGDEVNSRLTSSPTATQRTGELMEFSAPLPARGGFALDA